MRAVIRPGVSNESGWGWSRRARWSSSALNTTQSHNVGPDNPALRTVAKEVREKNDEQVVSCPGNGWPP
jgi:hypothetical protein